MTMSIIQDNAELMPQAETHARLREVRTAKGIPAARLASLVGVSRQTIYAIEDGAYVPNTVIALRLANALQVRVEELFQLKMETQPAVEVTADLLAEHPDGVQANQLVRLCDVNGRLMAAPITAAPVYLPRTDGVIRSRTARSVSVRAAVGDFESGKRILLAGCDPALGLLAAALAPSGIDIIGFPSPSRRALRWLKEGRIHAAGSHLLDTRTGEYNLPILKRIFSGGAVRVVTFAAWEQGLIFQSGNPKRIKSVADLARRDIRIINREKGAGSRDLLDNSLKAAGIPADSVRGYERVAPGHLAAASAVATNLADCCIATRSAARYYNLGFEPLAVERFDLTIPAAFLDLPAMKALLDGLNRSAFQRQLQTVAGYDTAQTGKVLI